MVGVSLLRISQPVFVAVERGLFKARGLTVRLEPFDTAQPLADELAAGRLDAAGYVAYPILFDREGGPPSLRIATAVVEDESHPLSFLLVKQASALGTIADLKGKSIGVLPTVAYRKWLEAVLVREGLTPKDVTITPIAPPLEVDALASGGVDALFTGDPMATVAIAKGVARPLVDAPVPHALGSPFLFGTFALSEQLVKHRPRTAAALVAALDEAIQLVSADPEVGRAAMAKYVREPERAFVSKFPSTRFSDARSVDPAALSRALAGERSSPSPEAVSWVPP